MSKHPKLDEIKKRMQKGKDFQLTRTQYIQSTGVDIPQDKSYTEKRSAVAKIAQEAGFEVQIIEEVIQFKSRGEKDAKKTK